MLIIPYHPRPYWHSCINISVGEGFLSVSTLGNCRPSPGFHKQLYKDFINWGLVTCFSATLHIPLRGCHQGVEQRPKYLRDYYLCLYEETIALPGSHQAVEQRPNYLRDYYLCLYEDSIALPVSHQAVFEDTIALRGSHQAVEQRPNYLRGYYLCLYEYTIDLPGGYQAAAQDCVNISVRVRTLFTMGGH